MLTPAQAEKLHASIDAARLPGSCRYLSGDKPACVIGQLAVLEGISETVISQWDGVGTGVVFSVRDVSEVHPVFSEYPIEMLEDLQQIWDTGSQGAKPRMHMIVDNHARC